MAIHDNLAGKPAASDADRPVDLSGDDLLPEQTLEDTDAGWGEAPQPRKGGLSQRDLELMEERPPHW
ncbi:hypothetical protein [Natronoglycomyces albus]|uniref:Uncharacterized protein n=1 Tax=Natronoglycomyces albus TaxID=2811108 RepID=A0A895XJN2_9ACTN|nr:hypothetical protein [Natronoglycomyces albus]QSB05544.1 hypothetical protein JQS30_00970 [Natronoglycomyces albus]